MFNKPHDVTALAVIEFTRFLFKTLAERYGGDSTLNELRVINQIILCQLEGQTSCVTSLHNLTGIPIPTVSRCVAKLQSDKWLSERQDPADGRKRLISLGPRFLRLSNDDFDAGICQFNATLEHGLPS